MPSKKSNLTYFDFRGGFTSEAGLIPKDPSLYEKLENVDINRDGSISRRKGLGSGTLPVGTLSEDAFIAPSAIVFQPEELPSNYGIEGSIQDYTILQVGNKLNFYGSVGKGEVVVEITGEDYTFSTDPTSYKTEFAIDDNTIFLFNKNLPIHKTIYSTTDTTPSFSTTEIVLKVRQNTKNQSDIVKYASPVPGADENYYVCIKSHTTGAGGSGDEIFPTDTTYWERYDNFEGETYTNFTLATTYFSNIIDSSELGYKDGCFSNGRMFAVGNSNTIYYSQTIKDSESYTKFYTEADPNNKFDNAIVDTDGGTLTISGATNIFAIAPFATGIIIFATNGIWVLRGVDGLFTPTNYVIDKVSDSGIVGQCGYTAVDDVIICATPAKISLIQSGDYYSPIKVTTLSDKIYTYWNAIDELQKKYCKLVYDKGENKLLVFYSTEDLDVHDSYSGVPTFWDVCLILDLTLGAWYTHTYNKYDVDGQVARLSDVYQNPHINGVSGIYSYLYDSGTPGGSNDSYLYVGVSFNTSFYKYDLTNTLFESTYDTNIWGVQQVLNDVSGRKQVMWLHTLIGSDNPVVA